MMIDDLTSGPISHCTVSKEGRAATIFAERRRQRQKHLLPLKQFSLEDEEAVVVVLARIFPKFAAFSRTISQRERSCYEDSIVGDGE